jgi:phosphoribosylaminoimidazole-succinocarboxamide synthase
VAQCRRELTVNIAAVLGDDHVWSQQQSSPKEPSCAHDRSRAAMSRRRQIYEGKAKVLFEGPEPGTLVQYFKDDASAFNNQKRGIITGKGVLNNRISEFLMLKLAEIGLPTHLVRRLNMREQLVREVEMIPIAVVVRNIAAGSLSQRLGIPEGTALPRSIVEYHYKKDALGDPLVSEEHITAFGWASTHDLDEMVQIALRVNDFLTGLFIGINIRLVDFKLESAAFTPKTTCVSSSPTRLARTIVGCGMRGPTRKWTRTASARISARSRKAIRR